LDGRYPVPVELEEAVEAAGHREGRLAASSLTSTGVSASEHDGSSVSHPSRAIPDTGVYERTVKSEPPCGPAVAIGRRASKTSKVIATRVSGFVTSEGCSRHAHGSASAAPASEAPASLDAPEATQTW